MKAFVTFVIYGSLMLMIAFGVLETANRGVFGVSLTIAFSTMMISLSVHDAKREILAALNQKKEAAAV